MWGSLLIGWHIYTFVIYTYNKCIKPLQIPDFLLIPFSLFYCLPVIKWAGGFFQFSKAGQEFKMSQAVTSWGFHSVTRVIFPCANSVVMSVTTTPTCLSFLVSSVTWSASPPLTCSYSSNRYRGRCSSSFPPLISQTVFELCALAFQYSVSVPAF